MSSSARRRLTSAGALALALAVPAGASAASKPYLDSKNVKVRAGYYLTISGSDTGVRNQGYATANLLKTKRHYTQSHSISNYKAKYSASGKTWRASLSAGFGKLGKIKVRFTPTGKVHKVPYAGRKCHGTHPTYRKGVIRGTILLKLGGKLKTIRVRRVGGTLTKPGMYSCKTYPGESGGGRGKPDKYDLYSSTSNKTGTKSSYLNLFKLHSGAVTENAGYTSFNKRTNTSEGHDVTELVSPGSFKANSSLTKATGHGRAPAFGGTLHYSGTAGAFGNSSGKLSGSFFGRLDTGRVIRAKGRPASMSRGT